LTAITRTVSSSCQCAVANVAGLLFNIAPLHYWRLAVLHEHLLT
jgi:hypothetical protein